MAMMQMRTMGSSYYFFNNIDNNIDKLFLLTPTSKSGRVHFELGKGGKEYDK